MRAARGTFVEALGHKHVAGSCPVEADAEAPDNDAPRRIEARGMAQPPSGHGTPPSLDWPTRPRMPAPRVLRAELRNDFVATEFPRTLEEMVDPIAVG
jgi:hypothetical protein